MADRYSKERRSRLMARIRSKGNKATELRFIRLLRLKQISGWRRHLNLPGKPDFVFEQNMLAVFIDGCFWHGCPKCYAEPKTNVMFWRNKIARNRARDRMATRTLRKLGWQVIRIWQCDLGREIRVEKKLRRGLVPSLKKRAT